MKQYQRSLDIFRSFMLLFFCSTLLATLPAGAQDSPVTSRSYRVNTVTFTGLQSIAENELKKSLPVQKGDMISVPGPEIPMAIDYLWSQKNFSDIRVEQTPVQDNAINLNFLVEELPVINQLVFKGNDKFDDKKLQSLAELTTGRPVDEQSLITARRAMLDAYEEKGYARASVSYKRKQLDGNRVDIIFSIDENEKVVIEKIRFHGNEAFDDDELRDTFKETSQNAWWKKIFGQPKLDTRAFEEDKQLVIAYYRNHGYRDAKIVRDTITYTSDRKGLLIDIYVEEGPLYHIRNVTWHGNTKEFASDTILNTVFGISQGDVYNAGLIQERLNFSQNNRDISSLYLDRGYLSFRSQLEEQVIRPDSVDLDIYLREGEQFRLGKINIQGNTKTKDHVIRRELRTVPGDMFSRKDVVRSVREISMLNYFAPEEIRPDIQPDESTNTVDITYNVTERQTDTFNASVGYSGNIGFTGALGVTFNNFSLKDMFKGEAWDPLPHGDGQKLGFQWQFGDEDYQNISLNFTEPWAFGTPTAVGFSIYNVQRDYDVFDDVDDEDTDNKIKQFGASLNIGRRLTWPDDYFSINWRLKYLHSEGQLLSFVEDASQPDEADEVSITQTITRNSIDNPIYPRRGSKNSISAQLAGGILPGSVDFYKFIGSSSWYLHLGNDFVVNLAAQHGYLGTFSDDDYFPYTESFYMGGSGLSSLSTVPLRGYDDRALGDLNDDTGLYTGRVYAKISTELRYPLTLSPSASVYALAFAEAGNLWTDYADFSYSDLKKSAGLGLRLYLPIIGLVGLDYGYGFDDVPGGDSQDWKFIFSFGQFAN
ncbi:outer membrane protein assembly factor BamA [Prosthecochloris sp. N3]|uniref:Outer membrane protein assembly factor BamA n=1 Tax=Prosthecochloris ethylica TaxID=2743976 RepID=A0ABR9XSC0_9CHLB|nr:outer membrane protein assembly factor BamA [Prosthecochloris ethylica]MBF0586828.1 outer membrane protein assembly factor BamA [Prosthecochloris ethylica]MBF0636824.1 outer membrane protein assembly factor BamA [Prosthecochloris ethylica]NUK48040.1 outer membrane protein assembly factor BamA [Prosthecochloris ethylica]